VKRPSPALVVAFIALVGAWGGPAVAQSLIGGREVRDGSLTGRDIRNRSLTGRELRSNTVTGRVVDGLSGRDIADDTLDGTDIMEETLGKVPAAAAADQAGGVRPSRVHFAREPGGEATLVLDTGTLRVHARCTSQGVDVRASAVTAGGRARASTTGAAGAAYGEDDDLRPGESFDVLPGSVDDVTGTLVYSGPEGGVVTLTFGAGENLPGCLLAGTAAFAPATP